MDSHMARNEHCICRNDDLLLSDIEYTWRYTRIFSDRNRRIEAKCFILSHFSLLVKIKICSVKAYQYREATF